jgi:hypothetical protein
MRRLLFGLGILLGIVAPQASPGMTAKVYRVGEDVYVNAELEAAFPAAALELAAAGSEVAFEVEARLEGREAGAVARRSLRYVAATGEWLVAQDGAVKRVGDRGTAIVLACRVWALPIGKLADFCGASAVLLTARSGIVDEKGGWHQAGILWGYVEPYCRFSFPGQEGIPQLE